MQVDFADGRLVVTYPYNATYNAIFKAFPNRLRWRGGAVQFEATIPAFTFLAQHFPDATYTSTADAQRTRCRALLLQAKATREAKDTPVPQKADLRARKYNVVPWEHQYKALELSAYLIAFALFMEQRTGKTKVELDNVDLLYEAGLIDALVVIAPNGVHENWVVEQIPEHLRTPCTPAVWYAAPKAAERKKLQAVLAGTGEGLLVLAVNIEALSTKRAAEAVEAFVAKRKCMVIMDEGHWIKTPGAARTKAVIRIGKRARYRRLLTGTPSTEGYEDLYSQFAFLDEQILGYTSFYAFKAQYCVQEEIKLSNNPHPVKLIVGYKNTAELMQRIAGFSYTVTRDQCFDLPGTVFGKRHIELTREQAKHYAQLRDELITEIQSREVTALLPITKLLRLRQVTCGFLSSADDPGVHMTIPGGNPRLDGLLDELKTHHGQTIIWAVFKYDLALISKTLGVPYYPGAEDRVASRQMVDDFQRGELKYFLANPAKAGTGLKIPARDLVWYSHSFSLAQRLQADDRPIFNGMKHKLGITDIVAPRTVDDHMLKALREKKQIADSVTGKEILSWL